VAGYAFISPFFILFAIFGLFPLLFTFWVSLHDWSLLGDHTWIGFDNYRDLFGDDHFWNAMFNTLGIFVVATVPQLLMALVLAQLLNQRLRARTLWRMGVLLPNITSIAAVGIIFTLLFARDFGLVNWLLGHVGVEPISWQQHRWSSWLAISAMVDWRWTGYNALIFLAALQAVPRDLYEAAQIDGASPAKQFWHITVPMLRPTIVFVSIVSTIGGIQLFTEPLLFNSGANAITGGTTRQFQTLTMYVYEQAFPGQEFGYASSVAWVMFLLIAVIALINVLLLRRLRGVS
jgi:cellobiose transport system permease protein